MDLTKRDFLYGFRNTIWKYALISITFTAIVILKFYNTASVGKIDGTILFFEVFKGVPYGLGKLDFQLPILWFLINCCIALVIGDYAYADLKNNGEYLLIRIKNIRFFWISKIIWVVANVIVYYLILFLITLSIGRILLGGFPNLSINTATTISSIELFLMVGLLYLTTSAALCLLQVSLLFFIKPIYAYLIVVILLLISIFIDNNLLPGQNSLILRHAPFDSVHILTMVKSLIYNLILSICAYLTGFLGCARKDII